MGPRRRVACRLCPCLDKVTPTCNFHGRGNGLNVPSLYCDFVLFPEGISFMSSTHVPADPNRFHLFPTRISNRLSAKIVYFHRPKSSQNKRTLRASMSTSRCTSSPSRILKLSGPGLRKSCTGSSRGTRCWSGICRRRSGLWAAR